MNPFLQILAQQGLIPMPPPRPQGLGTDWGQGVPEFSQAPVANSGNYQFPAANVPQATFAPMPNSSTQRGWDLGRQMSGIETPIQGKRPTTLSPQDLMALLASQTPR